MIGLKGFLKLDYPKQLKVLQQILKESTWESGELEFYLSGTDDIVKIRFLRNLIDVYHKSLNGKNWEHFSQLFYGYRKVEDDEFIYDNLIKTMMKVVFLDQGGTVRSEKKEVNEQGNYEYIPYRRGRFLALLNMIMTKVPEEIDFLDVGSGIGDKTVLASLHPRIIYSWGVELNQHTYELSKFFLERFYNVSSSPSHLSPISFINMDGLEFERKLVDSKRKILFYSYVPIYDSKKCAKLYERFLSQMKVGDYYWEISGEIRKVDRRKFKFVDKSQKKKYQNAPIWEKIDDRTFKSLQGN